jgi:YebC/PmpR family DNA-binding regulatory protein
MAGHSHWKQIKQQKGSADEKRGALFAKLLRAIAVAAREEPNPQFNPRLRTTIEKARAANVPNENIERAIARGGAPAEALEELTLEAYGPGGTALLIQAITDSKNRTVQSVKSVLKDKGGKWAEPGSVRWAFSAEGGSASGGEEWKAKFPQALNAEDGVALKALVEALQDLEDVQRVSTNAGGERHDHLRH